MNFLQRFLFTVFLIKGGAVLPFSRYLYSKVKESNSKFSNLILNQDEINFLSCFEVDFYPVDNTNTYCVNCDKLRKLFCN